MQRNQTSTHPSVKSKTQRKNRTTTNDMSSVAAPATANSCSRRLVKPYPLFAPTVYSPSRYRDVSFKKFFKSSSTQNVLKLSCGPSIKGAALEKKSSPAFEEKPHSHLSAAAASFFGGDRDEISHTALPLRSKPLTVPRAAYKDSFSIRYPVITEKPEWYWRTFACLPYLLALNLSDAGYFIQPLTDHYQILERVIYFVPGAISRFPAWFAMAYCYFSYLCIVRNKEWPHFFRFHLMMGMLLETSLQIVFHVGNFFPLIHFRGMFGMHVWAAVGFAYIITLLQCVRCALSGMYAHVPFVSDAAYIHTLFNIGGFHRFF